MAFGDLVQTAQVTSAGGASVALAFATTPVAGNILFAAFAGESGTSMTITGLGSNTWVQQANQHDAFFLGHTQGYVLSNVGGAETVTGAGGGGNVRLAIMEFEGPSDSHIGTATGGKTTGTAVTTGNISLTGTDQENGAVLLLGSAMIDASRTATPGTNWIERIDSAGLRSLYVASWVSSGTGNHNFTATWSSSSDWFARITILKPVLVVVPTLSSHLRSKHRRPAIFAPGHGR